MKHKGRPPEIRKPIRKQIYLPGETDSKVRKIAEEKRRTFSSIVREAIEKGLPEAEEK
jgi:predicted DNA-binding protein